MKPAKTHRFLLETDHRLRLPSVLFPFLLDGMRFRAFLGLPILFHDANYFFSTGIVCPDNRMVLVTSTQLV